MSTPDDAGKPDIDPGDEQGTPSVPTGEAEPTPEESAQAQPMYPT